MLEPVAEKITYNGFLLVTIMTTHRNVTVIFSYSHDKKKVNPLSVLRFGKYISLYWGLK